MFLYIIFNKLNCKMYVGITNNAIGRWKRHKSDSKSKCMHRKHSIHFALVKYGFDNFIFKVIETLPSVNIAKEREIEWIKFLKEERYQLYNETDGGDGVLGHKWTEEQKQKASKANSGKGNPMYGVQLFGEANGNFGKAMKPHVKEILLKHRRKLTDEQIEEIKILYKTGNFSQTELSKQFNICLTQIHRVVNNKNGSTEKIKTPLIKRNILPQDVLEIRRLFTNNEKTIEELSKLYNLSKKHLMQIIKRKKWKNI